MGKQRAINRKQRVVRPDAAGNARTQKVRVTHGARSKALLESNFDLRTKIGKAYMTRKAEVVAHMGGDLTAPQERIADQAVRLSLLEDIAWAELSRTHSIINAEVTGLHPAFDAVLRAARDHRAVLETIGLHRKEKAVPTLQEYLEQKAKEADDDGQA